MSYVSIRSFVLESRVRETTQTIGRVDTPKRERKWRELERELESEMECELESELVAMLKLLQQQQPKK